MVSRSSLRLPHVPLPLVVALAVSGTAVVGAGALYVTQRPREAPLGALVLTRAPLVRSVEFTGVVVPQERVVLGFEVPGRIAETRANAGDAVRRGATLASLETAQAAATLASAEARLESASARLAELQRGNRSESIAVRESQLTSAQAALEGAYIAYADALEHAYTTSDAELRTSADPLFENPRTIPRLTHVSTNSDIRNTLETERRALEHAMRFWRTTLDALPKTAAHLDVSSGATYRTVRGATLTASTFPAVLPPTIESIGAESRAHLIRLGLFFGSLAAYMQDVQTTTQFTETMRDERAAAIAAARVALSGALTGISGADASYTSTRSARDVARSELNLTLAGPTPEARAVLEAERAVEEAAVRNARAAYQKHFLVAPLAGTIASRTKGTGELVSATEALFTLDSAGGFELEATVSELDVVALEEKLHGTVVLDAYPDETFLVEVALVDPSETDVRGVSGYRVRLRFSDEDPRLRAGLTGNARVERTVANAALAVPPAYVKDGHVQLFIDDTVVSTPVVLGNVLPDGTAEIISGALEGALVVPYARP